MYYILLVILVLTGVFKNHLRTTCLLLFGFTVFLHSIDISTHQIILLFTLFLYWFYHKHKKFVCLFAGGLILFFPFIKTFFIQTIYGQPAFYDIPHSLDAEITPLSEQKEQKFKRGKYTIYYTPRAEITLSARVVYVDYIKNYILGRNTLYDTIAPLDVTIFIKSMADNWKKYKVKHEQRMAIFYNIDDLGTWWHEGKNLHIIPSNESIYNGFSTVKRGDIIIIKGYLIDWRGIGEFSYFKINTALRMAEASKENYNTIASNHCMQFFVTELYANGYLFK